MSLPTNRAELKEWCLRKLGKPVIEINVDDDQVDDRIDEALSFYNDYHYDATQKIYYSQQITANNVATRSITLPANIIGAANIFDVGTYYGVSNMFSIQYQFALYERYRLSTSDLAPFVMAIEHLQFMEQILSGKVPLRYNRKTNILYLDMDWNKVQVGQYVLVEAYQVVDPNTYTSVWSDRWLMQYCTALIKRNWGSNLTKFIGMSLPGNVQFNGQKIYDDAVQEIAELEEKMMDSYTEMPMWLIG